MEGRSEDGQYKLRCVVAGGTEPLGKTLQASAGWLKDRNSWSVD